MPKYLRFQRELAHTWGHDTESGEGSLPALPAVQHRSISWRNYGGKVWEMRLKDGTHNENHDT